MSSSRSSVPATTPKPVSIARHLQLVSSLATAPKTVELPLAECLGLVSAEPVTARLTVPPFTNSAMDGFAVRHADVSEATVHTPVTLPVTNDVPAGSPAHRPLDPGTAQRIMTGARMPENADTVIKVEDTDHAPGTVDAPATVTIFRTPSTGANVRRRGEALATGATVLPAGRRLTPEALAAAAAVGHGSLRVHPAPRVGVLATGSELGGAGEPLDRGKIPDSNGIMLGGLVRTHGGVVEQTRVPDDPERLRELVRSWRVDLIVTAGGISMGAYEVVRQGLPELTFHHVAQQPGGPQGAGMVAETPVLALPGNPVGAYVSFHVYVAPLLARLRGLSPDLIDATPAGVTAPIDPLLGRRLVRARAGAPWRSPAAKTQFMPVCWNGENVEPVHALGSKSHLVTSLPLVEGLAVAGPGIDHVDSGDELSILLTGGVTHDLKPIHPPAW